MDTSYEAIAAMQLPEVLVEKSNFSPATNLPQTVAPALADNLPVLVYNSYNLDPAWHSAEPANRVLLLEPAHFKKHPVSDRVMAFILGLSKNIAGIQVFAADFSTLQQLAGNRPIIFKSHPAFKHYEGMAEQYDELFPEVTGYYSSFFAYWKKCEQYLKRMR